MIRKEFGNRRKKNDKFCELGKNAYRYWLDGYYQI